MALPLPRVVPDVGPGGGLVTAMGGMNSLANDMLLRKINSVKAKYAPLTTQAEAASKLAYANLMGPQFLAKLMGNEGALANLSEDQKRNILSKVYGASTGQGTAANIFSQMQKNAQPAEQSGANPLSGWFLDKVKSAFSSPTKVNPLARNMPAAPDMPQGNGHITEPKVGDAVYGDDSGVNNEAMAAYDEWLRSSEGQREVAKGEQANIPDEKEIIEWKRNKDGQSQMQLTLTQGQQRQPTYAENTGSYRGVIKEGEKLGEIRAQAISDMDEQYQQAVQSEAPIEHLVELTQDHVFQNMRANVPFFQDKQLDALSKIGTPEEQRLVGDFVTTTTNAIANTVNSFRGRILDKEISMANQMKISPKDTWNVMMGKLASIKTFNELTKQRSRIASDLMAKKHINRGDAMERADKMVDGKAIRKEVEKQMQPKVTIVNKKTGEKKTVSLDEARRLGVPNV